VIRRATAIAVALSFAPLAIALADDVGGNDVIMIQENTATPAPAAPQPVTAPPPPWVEIHSTAIAAGIGARFGEGTLLVAGQPHPFKIRGLSLGDIGISRITAQGEVQNMASASDIAGHYVAVEAGAAAGKGVSTLTMRNEKGVVMTLTSKVKGAQLTLGAQGLEIELE
jgi:hypothetical protein